MHSEQPSQIVQPHLIDQSLVKSEQLVLHCGGGGGGTDGHADMPHAVHSEHWFHSHLVSQSWVHCEHLSLHSAGAEGGADATSPGAIGGDGGVQAPQPEH